MDPNCRKAVLLIADDDEDDCLLVTETLNEIGWEGELRFVGDGLELLDYLRDCDAGSIHSPCPDLILLDLNMPRKDGREALQEVRSDPRLKAFPIIVFTTSGERQDVELCTKLGVISVITKPAAYQQWLKIMEDICRCLDTPERFPQCGQDG